METSSSHKFRWRRRVAICLVAVAALRVYPEIVPWGVNPITLLTSCSWGDSFDSTQLGTHISRLYDEPVSWSLLHQTHSPRGLESVNFLGPGNVTHPMDNVNYWTWVVEYNTLLGPRSVAQGYMQGERIQNSVPPDAAHGPDGNADFQFQRGSLPVSYSGT